MGNRIKPPEDRESRESCKSHEFTDGLDRLETTERPIKFAIVECFWKGLPPKDRDNALIIPDSFAMLRNLAVKYIGRLIAVVHGECLQYALKEEAHKVYYGKNNDLGIMVGGFLTNGIGIKLCKSSIEIQGFPMNGFMAGVEFVNSAREYFEEETQFDSWIMYDVKPKISGYVTNSLTIKTNIAALDNDLELIKILTTEGYFPHQDTINLAAEKGNIPILIYLAKFGLLPDQEGADLAAIGGHLEVIKFLSGFDIYPSPEGLIEMVENERLDLAAFLYEKRRIPDVNVCTRTGKLRTLKFLMSIYVYPDKASIDVAATKGYLEIVKLLRYRIYDDS